MIRPCEDCNEPTEVADYDELAICPLCVTARRSAERSLKSERPQAGARHVARERGLADQIGLERKPK